MTGTLHPLIRDYVRGRYATGAIGPDRRRQLDYWLRRLDENFGDRPMSHLTPGAVERYMASVAHLAPESRSIARGCVNAFCGWLVREGAMKRNPVADVDRVRIPERRPRVLAPFEHALILGVLPDERAHAIVALAFGLGLRRGEIARLGVGDYDPSARMLYVNGKGGKRRELPVTPDIAAAVETYLKAVGWRSGPLVRSCTEPWKGLSPARVGTLVSGWMYEAGVKHRGWDGVSLHTYRRTAITEVIDASGDPKIGQELAGHASIETTYKHYVRGRTAAEIRSALEARFAA